MTVLSETVSPPVNAGDATAARAVRGGRLARAIWRRAYALVGASFGRDRLVRAELARIGLLTSGMTSEERDFLWRAQALPLWQTLARYALLSTLYIAALIMNAVVRTPGVSASAKTSVAALIVLAAGLFTTFWPRLSRWVNAVAARLGAPVDQVAYGLRLIARASVGAEPIGFRRRKQQIYGLRHVDAASKRAGIDPLASRAIWMDVTEGVDPRPAVRVFAVEFVRGENLQVRQSEPRRTWALPGPVAGLGAVAWGAFLVQVPKLVELAIDKWF
ncbi:hypothetical protein [Cellulomonas sp. PS-H5]|uniref:hypothetical protein n=1 Tax=Cellulomonas sp. PS-H5 TaxID=2820400 RepID=UPI001C5004B6|nr:hypothetical protein [Cellulomonas sp. PS-H5]MBW0254046.1 hypothetical protein [Cellulomonas sp. PS-H5]